jgi:hypothetical protein
MPAGGWGPPWPQAVELIGAIPGDRWTLIGGLMVQLHIAHAGLPMERATSDIDMVLHVETGAITFPSARQALESLGYEMQVPNADDSPIHRFIRRRDRVDVMVADRLPQKRIPTVRGRPLFQVPAGTSALRKTVDCTVERGVETSLTFSIPDVLGALVLKGAAYRGDPRDRERHLDDAAILACTVDQPQREATRLEGSDRGRLRALANVLRDPNHRSWLLVPPELRSHGRAALEVISQDPPTSAEPRRMGKNS